MKKSLKSKVPGKIKLSKVHKVLIILNDFFIPVNKSKPQLFTVYHFIPSFTAISCI